MDAESALQMTFKNSFSSDNGKLSHICSSNISILFPRNVPGNVGVHGEDEAGEERGSDRGQ